MLSTDQLEYTGYWNLIKSNPRKGVSFMKGALSNPKTAEELINNLNAIKAIISLSSNPTHDKKIINMVMTSKYRDTALQKISNIFYPGQTLKDVLNSETKQVEIQQNPVLQRTLGEYTKLVALPIFRGFNVNSDSYTTLDEVFSASTLQNLTPNNEVNNYMAQALWVSPSFIDRLLENPVYIDNFISVLKNKNNTIFNIINIVSYRIARQYELWKAQYPNGVSRFVEQRWWVTDGRFVKNCIDSQEFMEHMFAYNTSRQDSNIMYIYFRSNPIVKHWIQNSVGAAIGLEKLQKKNDNGKLQYIEDFVTSGDKQQMFYKDIPSNYQGTIYDFSDGEWYEIEIYEGSYSLYCRRDMSASYSDSDRLYGSPISGNGYVYRHLGQGRLTIKTSSRTIVYIYKRTYNPQTAPILVDLE